MTDAPTSPARQTQEAEATKVVVMGEEVVANEKAASAIKPIKDECEADLAVVLPMLNNALRALDSLTKANITEIKNMKNPPRAVKLVMEAVCKMLSIRPNKVNDPANPARKVNDYWAPSKALLADPKFLEMLMRYDKDNIPPSIISAVQPYMAMDEFDPNAVRKASAAAYGLCCWVRAMVEYDKAVKVVAPKKAKLAEAEAACSELMTAGPNATKAEAEDKTAELPQAQDRQAELPQVAGDPVAQVEGLNKQLCCSCPLANGSDGSPLKGRFVVPAEEVRQLLASSGKTLEELLHSLITPASKLAWPPISGFCVGAVALGGSGNVYVGVNVEFPGAPLNNSIHAEQCLLVSCLRRGETCIRALAVSSAPCGHCRQFYAEVKDVDSLEFIFGSDAQPKYLGDLLPERFGPADLQSEPFPLLLERQSHNVVWQADAEAQLAARGGEEAFQRAAEAALRETRQCYAPYTRCHSGASLITAGGRVFAGGYIESAAYNPSLSPFHCAVVDAITSYGITAYDQIAEVVLAERPGAPVQHAANIRLLLAAVAPAARLTVLPLA
ncbi:hypothetical protein Agub_g9261 [Astrephomene gubernaculifera]|uniref:CMP/dCMP-type deaminase domain-containing protein n=1 Tax=Astrephomene gubernaculifera TaxID=47775 RepID=A0AAD3HN47_9CHLO|nr:hypothetical protein Agub_g9261 [Astrephomene gubernaculifera]